MGKVIGQGNKIYTAEQIKQYNEALDNLDALMNNLDKLVEEAEKAEADKNKRTVHAAFENSTGADLTNFTATLEGGGSSSPETIQNGGSSTPRVTIPLDPPLAVKFIESVNQTPYEITFTIDKSVTDGTTLTGTFSMGSDGKIVYTES